MIEKISNFFISFIPKSPLFFLLYLFLFVIASVLFIILLSKPKKNKKQEKENKKLTIEDLLKIAKNPKSTTDDLLRVFILFNENFKIEENEDKAFELFEKALNHKSRNKALFDFFHGILLPKNIKYKDKLDEIERKALNK
ncbi:hypothetical protein JCM11957_02850 [Caminibacter profundus]